MPKLTPAQFVMDVGEASDMCGPWSGYTAGDTLNGASHAWFALDTLQAIEACWPDGPGGLIRLRPDGGPEIMAEAGEWYQPEAALLPDGRAVYSMAGWTWEGHFPAAYPVPAEATWCHGHCRRVSSRP